MANTKKQGWNPAAGISKVGSVVDSIIDTPPPHMKAKAKPAKEKVDHRRAVIYLPPGLLRNLKQAALDSDMDISAKARELFMKAGLKETNE